MALFLIEFRSQTMKLLGVLRLFVALSGSSFPCSFFMVKSRDISMIPAKSRLDLCIPLSMLLLKTLNVPKVVNMRVLLLGELDPILILRLVRMLAYVFPIRSDTEELP